ncbi:tRNA adenosine(34) deaminase TadA [Streptomyces sp. CNQ085]|nr:tRNA adenosine(34) deaminase TadA [Streptomyces sp. CNQ085]MCI0387083.1 tRNA adenosine(34) deaminase TadA [Streptomyces sp. CNQ085]
MRRALAEAARAPGTGDVPVGAVVLDPDGAVLGLGRNEREATGDPTAHAEVVAIREAARAVGEWRLSGCTLVVTLEPCTMCAGAIVLSRLERVVYGAVDEKAGAVGSLWDAVRDRRLNHRPEVVSGVLARECGALLTDFFRAPSRTAPHAAPRPPEGALEGRSDASPGTDFGTRPTMG